MGRIPKELEVKLGGLRFLIVAVDSLSPLDLDPHGRVDGGVK